MQYPTHNASRWPVGLLFLLLVTSSAWSQVSKDVSMRIFGQVSDQLTEYRVAAAPGFGIGAELGKDLGRSWTFNVQMAYDHQSLDQDSVLNEWNWDYWEDTYIEWLPGGDYHIINETLEYMSGDSIYSAHFIPTQKLTELRLSMGLEYHRKGLGKLEPFAGINSGFSIYDRSLKMQEDWTKRYRIAADTTATDTFPGLNYDYEYQLTHFAPAKKGLRPFISPRIGFRYAVSEKYDVEFGWVGVFYPERLDKLEDLFKIGETDFQAFPLRSKHQIWLAFRFNY